MADEQIIVDIKVSNDDIKKADKAIDSLSNSLSILSNNIDDAKKENKELSKSLDELNKKEKEGTKLTADEIKKREELTKKLRSNEIEIAKNQQTLSKLKRERTANIKVIQDEQSKYDALSNKLNLARKRAKDLGAQFGVTSDEFNEAAKEVQALDEELKEIDQTLGQSGRKVADYENQFLSAFEKIGISFGQFKENIPFLEMFNEKIRRSGKEFKAAQGGTKKFVSGMKLVKLAIIGTGIGALVLAVIALITYFTKTEKGAEKLKVALAAVGGVIDGLISGVASFGKLLANIWTNPKQAISDFKNEISEIPKKIKENVKAATELAKIEILYRKINRAAQETINTLEAQRDIYQQIADDSTLSLTEQLKATNKVLELENKAAVERERIAQRNLEIASKAVEDAKRNGKESQDLQDAELDAKQALLEAETAVTIARAKNAQQQRQITQDLIGKELDYLLDGSDNLKTVNEAKIKNEKLTFKERQNILNETQEASAKAFKDSFALIQSLTNEQINSNELLSISDQKLLYEKIKTFGLSEDIEQRTLDAIRDRRTAEQDFADLQQELSEKAIEQRKKDSVERIDIAEQEQLKRQELITEQNDFEINKLQERVNKENEIRKKDAETQAMYTKMISDFTIESFAIIGEQLATEGGNIKSAFKQILITALNFLQSLIPVFVAQITGISLSSLDNAATFFVSGTARAIALTAGLEGLAAAAKAGVNSFGGGINDIVSIGGSHASGNDVTVVGYDKSGNSQIFGRVEKGEAMPVIRKSAINDYQIMKLNGQMSSKNRTFAQGTPDITSKNQTTGLSQADILEAFQKISIGVKVEDITSMIQKKVEVKNNGVF